MSFSKEVLKIFETAKKAGGEARIVGGAVRDHLLLNTPIESGDVDFAINLPVDIVFQAFEQIGCKVITKYATNIVIYKNRVFEVTSTRKDENCDGRHATMIFTPSFEEDSNRRDFTVNALYMNEMGEIFDYHNGKEDLSKGIIRFIGNPLFRIEEDYLRIWRFFRFFALYGATLEEEGFEACKVKADKIYLLSKERATAEVLKLLKAQPSKIKFTLSKMIEAGILKQEEWNLNFTHLPKEPFLRFVILNKGNENNLFLYTAKQKGFIKLYNKVASLINNKVECCLLYYTLPKEDFNDIIKVYTSFNSEFQFDFNLPPLPFNYQTIISEGFEGGGISKEYAKRIRLFVEKMVPDV